MDTNVEKKYALVTGGASGMGLACVKRLSQDGFSVFFLDRNAEQVEAVTQDLNAQGFDVKGFVVDLTDEPALEKLIDELPSLSALVNNAGIFDERLFDEASSADFRRMFEVNTIAVHNLTQLAVRKMPNNSRVVIIASRAYLGAKNHIHYVSSKSAVVGYTRAAAMELASREIMVNAIAPGLIETPILKSLTPERRKAQEALQPTGKAGMPEDIAHAVSFFSSAKTCFITGQVLFVDGGKSLGGSYA